MNPLLNANNLHVRVKNGGEILRGLNLVLNPGEFHVIMGPNGSGKTTLGLTIMGHPNYEITEGKLVFEGEEINELPPDERARRGIFMAFQSPEEIEGVKILDYLRLLLEKVKGVDRLKSHDMVMEKAKEVWFTEKELARDINVGFSGGERKRFEILQALLLDPKLVILDEPDSGVDVDSLSLISLKLHEMQEQGKTILLITHYGRILQHVDPSRVQVHIIKEGKIVMHGREKLVKDIEEKGFKKVFEECGCNE